VRRGATLVPNVRDSKQYVQAHADEERAEVAARLKTARGHNVAVVSRSAADVDRDGLDRSIEAAMTEAVHRVAAQAEADTASGLDAGGGVDFVWVDGTAVPPALSRDPRFGTRAVPHGDAVSYVIAGASVLAKTARDRLMCAYGRRYPAYAFEANKGYPSKEHQRALARVGVCPVHRRSVAPIRAGLLTGFPDPDTDVGRAVLADRRAEAAVRAAGFRARAAGPPDRLPDSDDDGS
jgi:ribonuclease HII